MLDKGKSVIIYLAKVGPLKDNMGNIVTENKAAADPGVSPPLKVEGS